MSTRRDGEPNDALARSEARFRALVQYSSDVITVLAPDGTVVYNTPAVGPVLGYAPEELTGRSAFELVHPEDIDTVLARFGVALQQPGVPVPVTFRFRHRDGHWVTLESIGSNRLDDPNVHGVVVNSRDVTERDRIDREKAEEAVIAAALARVGREIISALSTPALLDRLCAVAARVLECDRSHIVLYDAAESGFRIMAGFGDTPEEQARSRTLLLPEAIGAGVLARLRADDVTQVDPQRDPLAAAVTQQFGITAALYMALRRGEELIGVQSAEYLGGATAFTARQERIARGIAQLASPALEDARLVDELERANRLKSEFVATMSHELRTPLNIILGYNSLLLDGTFGALSPEQHDVLERADRNAHALLELISATLDLSRLEAGQVPLDLREFHLHELLGELAGETRELRHKPGVRIEWSGTPPLPPLRSDAAKVKVVLKNLVGNAIKFTDHGRIVVRSARRDDGVEIAVSDTGIGIGAELLEEIFEPFRQATANGAPYSGGVGLGLYIVRRLLGELGGSVTVDSTVGVGSTFRVWLPLRLQRDR
jgi:PAS domain S-box-containing protein